MQPKLYEIPLSFARLTITTTRIGEDILITLSGGEKSHIGCCVLAVPRRSLTGDGSLSCTSSVLNVTGHRDEELCRYLAEKACRISGHTVVCTGGFHVDDILPEQIREVTEAVYAVDLTLP